jgi:flagellin
MAMTINTNVVSINSQRNLSLSGNSLGTTMQRLSSGLRVNSAKDDAAGLAIAERMNAQSRGLAVAARNANDGISLAQTTEGALGKVGDMLQRMRELAVQSSNATNSTADREALQAEVNQLRSEIDRVAKTTSFNGTKVLDGSFTGGVFQVGSGAGDNITVGATTKATADGLGNVEFGSSQSKTFTAANIQDLDKVLQGVKINVGGTEHTLADIKVANSGEERLGQIVSAINAKTADTGVTAFLEKGANAGEYQISMKSDSNQAVAVSGLGSLNKAAGATEVKAFAQAELDALDAQIAGFKAGTYANGAAVVTAKAGVMTAADGLLAKLPGFTTDRAGTIAATGTSVAKTLATAIKAFDDKLAADFETTGFDQTKFDNALKALTDAVDVAMSADDTKAVTSNLEKATLAALQLNDKSTFAEVNTVVSTLNAARTAYGDTAALPQITLSATLDNTSTKEQVLAGVKDLQGKVDTLGLSVSGTEVTKHKGIDSVDIGTQAGAWEAIKQIDSAIDQVNAARGDLGALQTRFEKTVENIDIQNENITAARGRIVDADFATETANLSRAQILQQAGTAMVAQANQLPQQVLSLLR